MIAAGAVVEAGSTVASGELWAGNPARRVRELKQEEKDYLESLPARCGEVGGNWRGIVGGGCRRERAGGGQEQHHCVHRRTGP